MSRNKLKTEKPESKKPRGNDPNVLKQEKEAEVKVKELVKDERTHKVMGVVLLLLSLYCFIAFTSYLFTWEDDQDKVFRYAASVLFMDDLKVENLLGRLGAFVSHWFIYGGFGVASYLFCYFFFILGMNFIVGRRVFRIWRNIKYIMFGLLFISTAAAFVTGMAGFPWGGALGDAVSKWITGFLGKAGAALLLLVTGFAWIIWKYNLDFKWLMERKPKKVAIAIDDEEEEEIPVIADNKRRNGLKGNGVVVIPPTDETGDDELPEMQLVVKNITVIPPASVIEEEEEEDEDEEAGPLLYIE